MTSKLKCPFCNKPLQPTLRQSDEYWCENYDCPRTNIEWVGSQKLWQELIRTRKALDVAKDAIDVISLKYHKDTPSIFLIKYAQNAKDQITALEQKETTNDK